MNSVPPLVSYLITRHLLEWWVLNLTQSFLMSSFKIMDFVDFGQCLTDSASWFFEICIWLRSQLTLITALARVFSILECYPAHHKVASLIPGQGTYLGCGFHRLSGCMQETAKCCLSPSLPAPSLFPFFSLYKECPTFWHLWAMLEEEQLSWATHWIQKH